MKKYLKMISAMFMLTFAISTLVAQDAPQKSKVISIEERIEKQSSKMKEQLNLTDEQTAKVKAILTERNKKTLELRKTKANDKVAMKTGMKEVRDASETEMMSILTEEQKAKYTKLKEERKELQSERKKAHKK